tara:strand:- start:101 stop:697 length:597 start_codon:yes stop_codon:yes gene_type:complete
MNNDNKIRYKLVLFGDTAVGKSCIVTRFVNGEFFEFQEPTIGAAFSSKSITLNDNNIVFEIWDTAGQERYRSLAPMYYRSATVAVIVYDITNKDSFYGAKMWIEELKRKGPDDCLKILVGNKCDLNHDRKVIQKDVYDYVYENDLLYFETSAKKNINVNSMFEKIAGELLQKNKKGINHRPKLLHKNYDERSNYYGCC